MSDHIAIETPSKLIEFRGVTYTVSPLTLKEMPSMFRAAAKCGPGILKLMFDRGEMDFIEIANMIADMGDAMTDAIMIGLRLDRAAVEALDPEACFILLPAIADANEDLFRRCLKSAGQAFTNATRKFGPAIAQTKDGQTPSSI